ncbi:MAG: head decoration protein [Desulfobacteraceae bacterium]|jgi:hypothetical protein
MSGILGTTETEYSELSQLTAQEGAVMKRATLASGNNLSRGDVLERSSQKMTQLSTAANARAILAQDCDASEEDKDCWIYVLGHFRYTDLGWPTITAADKKTALEALEDAGISVDVDHTTVEATA